jgi:thiamine biosynthesis lipoprotein
MKALMLAALAATTLASPASDGYGLQVRYVMGTLYTIEAEGPHAGAAIEAAFAEIKRLDASLSVYKPTSELSRVNAAAGRGWTPVSAETERLVERALALAEETQGAFDPTVGPLVALWGFKDLDYRVPTPGAIAAARALVGYQHLAARRKPAALKLDARGMAVDLGATAKGYAVARANGILRARGITRARVDAGGNQAVLGGANWTFGVKHPREEGALLGSVGLSRGGVATAGDAERGFWEGDVRYGHILDPHTGRPGAGMLSVTVVAPTAEEADALDTPLYLLGPERGRALLARHPGCAALFVAAGPTPGSFRLTATDGLDWRPAPAESPAASLPPSR